jgi:hypothetical protein
MSADKRSVHTDALETLGYILSSDEARDAIHLAVEPVIAGSYLNPGAHIQRGDDNKYYNCPPNEGQGIVDPFIQGMVRPGNKFWLVVYPRKISSLRHVWTHPDFDDLLHDFNQHIAAEASTAVVTTTVTIDPLEDRKAESKAWIEEYVHRLNDENGAGRDDGYYGDYYGTVDYDELMQTAKEHATSGWSYLSKGGLLEGVCTEDAFWDHFIVVTGIVPKERGNFFSCSC